MSWLSRFLNVFRSRGLDKDLDDEIQFHLSASKDDLTESGATPEQAEAQARRRFGNPLFVRESSREVKLFPRMESIARDIQFGVRLFRKNAAVTASAVLSLSLAIGACTGAFSLINALILRPLPVN